MTTTTMMTVTSKTASVSWYQTVDLNQ